LEPRERKSPAEAGPSRSVSTSRYDPFDELLLVGVLLVPPEPLVEDFVLVFELAGLRPWNPHAFPRG